MRVIVDTNVLISGVFFGGWSYQVLKAWRDGKIKMVVSLAILEEYRSVTKRLGEEFPGVDSGPFLDLLSVGARVSVAPSLPAPVCEDPDDDKFLACAVASGTRVIVSGDRALQRVSGYRGIRVVSPRRFVEEYLE